MYNYTPATGTNGVPKGAERIPPGACRDPPGYQRGTKRIPNGTSEKTANAARFMAKTH